MFEYLFFGTGLLATVLLAVVPGFYPFVCAFDEIRSQIEQNSQKQIKEADAKNRPQLLTRTLPWKKRVMKNMILFGMMCFGAGEFFAFVILDPETLKLVGTTILKKMMFIK